MLFKNQAKNFKQFYGKQNIAYSFRIWPAVTNSNAT